MTPAERQHFHQTCAEARRLARRTLLRLAAERRVREVRECMEELAAKEVRL